MFIVLFAIAVFSIEESRGQFSTLLYEDFEGCTQTPLPSGCGTLMWNTTGSGSPWNTTNGICTIDGTYSLAVGSDVNICEYNVDFGTTSRIAYTQFSTAGYQALTIKFKWQAGGEVGVDFGSLMYSNDGLVWTNASLFQFQGQSVAQSYSSSIPTALNNDSTAFIGFEWNDDANALGAFPGFVIDSLAIFGELLVPADPPAPVTTDTSGCAPLELTWGGLPSMPSNVVWYWQAGACGTDTVLGTDTSLFVTTSGVYYLRAYNTLSQQWSDSCSDISIIITGNSSSNSLSDTICEGDSLLAGGMFQTTTGLYYDTLINSIGCDSIITTSLTVIPTNYVMPSINICPGDSALIYGTYQGVAGTYYDSLTSITGCDSVAITTLFVNPIFDDSVSVSICQGDSVVAGGIFQTTTGIYYDSLTTIMGCDSITTTSLTVNPIYLISSQIDICPGDSVLIYGNLQGAAGVYNDSSITPAGCDSISVTTLTVNLAFDDSIAVAICQGDSIYAAGAFQTTTGIYYDSLTTIMGCDSITTTSLTVNPSYFTASQIDICPGDSVLIYGNLQGATGVYYDSLITTTGCDSIFMTGLTVNPTYFSAPQINICEGDSIFAGGMFQTTNGVYYDSLSTSAGCDSITITSLTVNPTYFSIAQLTICDGDSVLIYGNFQGTTGTYYDSLTSGAGCDSVRATSLTVNSSYLFSSQTSICEGESVLIYGNLQGVAGLYYDSMTTSMGCDSVFITELIVHPLPTPVITPNGNSLVSSSTLGNQWYMGGIIITGAVAQTLPITQSGSYTVVVTDTNGCTATSAPFDFAFVGMEEFAGESQMTIAPNPFSSTTVINFENASRNIFTLKIYDLTGQLVLTRNNIQESQISIDGSSMTRGTYLVELQSNNLTLYGKLMLD